MESLAAVDLGSNSFHMVIARVDDDEVQIVDRIREPVRLAAGLEEVAARHGVTPYQVALAWVLLAAPVVWEHHYVLAIPLLLWAAAGWGRRHAVALGAAALLCFAVPTFDVFPWSYHRLVGLAWILWLPRDPNPDADPNPAG